MTQTHFKQLFDGETFFADHDLERLSTQMEKIKHIMTKSKKRWTLSQLQSLIGGSEAGISARLRDLRKPRFGGYNIVKQRVGDHKSGLWEYWIEREDNRE